MTQFETTTVDGIAVVRPVGRLNMVSAPQLSQTVADLVADGASKMVIDLSDTDTIDSSGLGALVSCLKKARSAGGDLRLAGPNSQARTVLELTNLSRVLKPSVDVSTAIASF